MITQNLAKVLPVLVMIILGRVCATKGILNDEQHAGLKNVIGDILLPVVLFQAFFTADYGTRMLLVFVLVFVGYGVALAAGYALRRFVRPYDRFMRCSAARIRPRCTRWSISVRRCSPLPSF